MLPFNKVMYCDVQIAEVTQRSVLISILKDLLPGWQLQPPGNSFLGKQRESRCGRRGAMAGVKKTKAEPKRSSGLGFLSFLGLSSKVSTPSRKCNPDLPHV